MIVTRDRALAARCRSIVDCGRQAAPEQSPQQILGANYRLSEFQSAIAMAQLDRLESYSRSRARSAALLDEMLARADGIEVTRPLPGVTRRPVYSYSFRYVAERAHGVPRDRFLFELFLHGIPATGSMYVPVYEAPEYGRHDPRVSVPSPAACPNAECAAREMVWLPHMLLTAGTRRVRRIAETIARCAKPASPGARP
jgi:dTDP-4-amino-4,6-dideoxygalactose transaminase